MRFPEALCVRDALLGGGRSCFLVAICVGNAFGSVEMVAGQVLLGGGRCFFGGGTSLLVAGGVFLVAGGVFWWRKVFFGGVRSFFWWRESFGSRKSCFLVAICVGMVTVCVGSYGSVGRVATRDVLVAEGALFGGNMRRFLWIRTKGGKGGKGGGNTRGAPHRTAFRLHVSDTAFNALVAEEALFGGNMRGVGGNTRRVHNVLVAEEALFGGNMRGVRSRSIIFDAC